MFDWKSEFEIVVKYVGSGAINTTIGFVVIFSMFALGGSPLISNLTGYFVGIWAGFFLSRNFVFYSDGNFISQGWRYVLAFIVSYCINLLVLYTCIQQLGLNKYVAQAFASIAYVVAMYPLSRWIVFSRPKVTN